MPKLYKAATERLMKVLTKERLSKAVNRLVEKGMSKEAAIKKIAKAMDRLRAGALKRDSKFYARQAKRRKK